MLINKYCDCKSQYFFIGNILLVKKQYYILQCFYPFNIFLLLICIFESLQYNERNIIVNQFKVKMLFSLILFVFINYKNTGHF